MKKFLKIILYFFVVVFLFIIFFTIYHHIALKKEAKFIKANGIFVTVDGHKMHIYSEGSKNNKPTIVLMSGSGVAAPVYDYKVLYSKLSDEYHVVVIEKFGYGYSDISGLTRDIDTLVREDREALKLAGESGLFVLMPHSMSCLEALYWVQHYPNEVPAIVGLDMAEPEFYKYMKDNTFQLKLISAVTFIGLHRIPILDSMNTQGLTKEEIQQHRYLMNKMTLNSDVLNESKVVKDNARTVEDGSVPDIPMLLFSSNGEGTGDSKEWRKYQTDFAKESQKRQLIKLDCGHMMHYYKSDYIAQNIKSFLKKTFK